MISPIDELYIQIFGGTVPKSGAAFERFSAIASHIVSGGKVTHDARIRGAHSESLYQLDVHQALSGKEIMGEAKDYTKRNSKVGREDIQKLVGALVDIEHINSGDFWSATGYTKPAVKYASVSSSMIGKPIALRGLRESTEVDAQGFVKTIRVTMTVYFPNLQIAVWTPHWSNSGLQLLKSMIPEGEKYLTYSAGLDDFYDLTGSLRYSIFELTSQGYGEARDTDGSCHGCFLLNGLFAPVLGELIELKGLEYCVPIEKRVTVIEVTDSSAHRLAILDQDGKPTHLLSDDILKKYQFDDNNRLCKAPDMDF